VILSPQTLLFFSPFPSVAPPDPSTMLFRVFWRLDIAIERPRKYIFLSLRESPPALKSERLRLPAIPERSLKSLFCWSCKAQLVFLLPTPDSTSFAVPLFVNADARDHPLRTPRILSFFFLWHHCVQSESQPSFVSPGALLGSRETLLPAHCPFFSVAGFFLRRIGSEPEPRFLRGHRLKEIPTFFIPEVLRAAPGLMRL